MKKAVFTGSGVAIVTPMNADFSINYTELGNLIDWQIENGTDCIISCGTTGESSTMTDDEHVECMRFTVERAASRVPVVAGVGSNDTAYAVWLSKQAKAVGANALLHVTPYYNKTSQAGLIRHFLTCAEATDLPVILYNVPSRTGLNIAPETYLELSKHTHIVATKEANSNIAEIVKTVSLCGDNLVLYSGNDDQIVPLMSMGAQGVISVIANIMPQQTHNMCRLFLDGKTAQAAKLQADMAGIISAVFLDVNPIPVKEALNLLGRQAGPCRLPLIEMAPGAKNALIAEMKKIGLLK